MEEKDRGGAIGWEAKRRGRGSGKGGSCSKDLRGDRRPCVKSSVTRDYSVQLFDLFSVHILGGLYECYR